MDRPLPRGRRGQASFEYLSTYGFAIFSLLLVLGALSYFGLFDVSKLRSNTCSFPDGIACADYIIDKADPGTGTAPYLQLLLVNQYGVNLTITDVGMTSSQLTVPVTCTPIQPSTDLPANGNVTVWCGLPVASFATGQRYDGLVTVNFTQKGGSYVHTVQGRFSVPAQ